MEQVAEFNNAWKGRGNLGNLIAELNRQKETKFDFVADSRTMEVVVDDHGNLCLVGLNDQAREMLPGCPALKRTALNQIAQRSGPGVPVKFVDKMMAGKGKKQNAIYHRALTDLINHLRTTDPEKNLIRCMDDQVRAVLSDKYRVIDNYDMAFACMDVAHRNSAEVIEANLSDNHMRIKFTTQKVWDTVNVKQQSGPQGNWYAAAIGNQELQGKTILGAKIKSELPGGPGTIHPVATVSNSETGCGGFNVRIGILMGICFNVATLENVVQQVHLGSRLEEGIFSAKTIEDDTKVIVAKAKDAVQAAFNTDSFKWMVAKAKDAQEKPIESPTDAVNNVIKDNSINEEHREALLEYFLRDYDQTQFGLAQAVSRLAQDVEPDSANELENLAGAMIAA